MRSMLCVFMMASGLALSTSEGFAQLPKEALCAVCRVHEGETAPEKVVAHSEYQGTTYYFCSKKCQEIFAGDPAAYVPPVLPRPAPGFALKNLAGETISLASLRGKITLLDFWATWCKPCVKSMPALQKLHAQYSARDFTVVGISIDEKADKRVPPFLAKHEIDYPILLDAGETPAWDAYQVKVIPAMFLIDRKGQIVKQWVGEADLKEVESAVTNLLDLDKKQGL